MVDPRDHVATYLNYSRLSEGMKQGLKSSFHKVESPIPSRENKDQITHKIILSHNLNTKINTKTRR